MTIQAIRGRRRDQPTLDTLPENLHYNDTGCEASAYCLECPLPKCKYDDPSWYHQFKQESRDEAILSTYAKGATVFEVAKYFRVSSRTIHRALRRGRTSILESAGLVSVQSKARGIHFFETVQSKLYKCLMVKLLRNGIETCNAKINPNCSSQRPLA